MATFFSAFCPSCGAKIDIQSQTTLMVACPKCQSNLLFNNNSLALSGEHSAILEDFSAIQIGSTGIINNDNFQVIGRLQVQYHDKDDKQKVGGTWNEWYIQFNSGKTGWLSDSNGHYVYLEPYQKEPDQAFPAFFDALVSEEILLGKGHHPFYVSDIREAKLLHNAVQGELPFIPKKDSTIRVIDARSEERFITLDYSHSYEIEVFLGFAVNFHQLSWQHLRSELDIQETAGELKGATQESKCPNCGGNIQWITGITENVNCRYCGSEIAINDNVAELIKAHNLRAIQHEAMALEIGQKAKIDGKEWTVIGMMCQSELEGDETNFAIQHKLKKDFVTFTGDQWHEYLLFSYPDQFMWLVQSGPNDWAVSNTQNIWPKLRKDLRPIYPTGQLITKLYDYGGRVKFAIGSFYYQVSPGDMTYYVDYGKENEKLSMEITDSEMSWSKATSISQKKLNEWFKDSGGLKQISLQAQSSLLTHSSDYQPKNNATAVFFIIFLVINIPIFLMDFGQFLISAIIVGILLHSVANN
ncbi:DUF4178 domain-containing protein [Wohlfahrtiimonas larvae]|uniref:DUF4178 domain-containing protein n=1 Tax=Wohlfahrtiimonas larvae TaxID=1157986 RepID=A0ABP9MX44_9GAMM|nr:DUF4178 domain-containing protein [Wohlfahrtiimonas larvae]